MTTPTKCDCHEPHLQALCERLPSNVVELPSARRYRWVREILEDEFNLPADHPLSKSREFIQTVLNRIDSPDTTPHHFVLLSLASKLNQ